MGLGIVLHEIEKIIEQVNDGFLNWKDLSIKKRIDVIPIVERLKKVVDVITFEDIFKKNKSSIRSKTFSKTVIIMAGGKGTRLEPFTNVLPKPLVPINEKPVIEHIIEKFTEKINICSSNKTRTSHSSSPFFLYGFGYTQSFRKALSHIFAKIFSVGFSPLERTIIFF